MMFIIKVKVVIVGTLVWYKRNNTLRYVGIYKPIYTVL